jgi:membrane associated rhomboid family serine protease
MSYRPYYPADSATPRPSGFLSRLPPVTAWMIKANVAVFLFFWLFRYDGLYANLALSLHGIRQGAFWQPLTYMFLHGSFIHILFNMLTLYFLGPETERTMGSKHFLAMYLISGLLGGLGWLWLSAHPVAVCVGASGAIFGVMAAFATLFPRRQLTVLIMMIFPVTLPAWQLVAGLSLIQFLLLTGGAASNIAYAAHLAGAFAGFLYIDQLFENTTLRHLWARLRDYVAQRPPAPRAAPPPPDPAEVDRILDKITAQGIQSLTRAERQILHRASRTF